MGSICGGSWEALVSFKPSILECKQRIISGNENYALRWSRPLRLVSQKRGIIFFPWNSYCIQGVCWKPIIWIPVLRTRLSLQNPFFFFSYFKHFRISGNENYVLRQRRPIRLVSQKKGYNFLFMEFIVHPRSQLEIIW